MSPLASAAWGRSFSRAAASPRAEPGEAVCEGDGEGEGGWTMMSAEVGSLCRLALPISVTNLAGFAIGLVTLSMAGRLGAFELSAIVLAITLFNVTGLSLLIGLAAAMETLCGQAYGARRYRLVGVVLQRALLLTTCLAVMVALAWSQAEALLLAFRQDPLLARSAARYLRLVTPALWFTALFEVLKRYLLTQGVVRPPTAVTLLGLALAPAYSWLLIFHLDLRLDGAALAVVAIQGTMAALLGGYVAWRDLHQLSGLPTATWHGWSTEALKGWGAYLRYALPSTIMICCEWWTFEAMILMAGMLPNPEVSVAVMGILINTSGLVWMFVSGFALAVSQRVSTSLGAGRPGAARRATWTAVGIALALELSALVLFLAARKHWARLFTDAPSVVERTAALLPVFALSLPGDGANATLQGLLRGAGRQGVGAITNICSYWLLGIPSAAYLAFTLHLGLHGLWWGLVLVNCVQGCLMTAIALRFNFPREAAKAATRVLAQAGSGAGALREPLLAAGGASPHCEEMGVRLPCASGSLKMPPRPPADAAAAPAGSGSRGGAAAAAAPAAPG